MRGTFSIRFGYPRSAPFLSGDALRAGIEHVRPQTPGLLWFRRAPIPWPLVAYVKVFPTGWGARVGTWTVAYSYRRPPADSSGGP